MPTTITGLEAYQARLRALPQAVARQTFEELKSWESDAMGYMGTTAIWHDHTYNARKGLRALAVLRSGPLQEFVVYHTVFYGPFLERVRLGHFAILWQTIRVYKPLILMSLRNRLQRVYGGTWTASA